MKYYHFFITIINNFVGHLELLTLVTSEYSCTHSVQIQLCSQFTNTAVLTLYKYSCTHSVQIQLYSQCTNTAVLTVYKFYVAIYFTGQSIYLTICIK